ncbi:DUF6171 family protein [Fimbriiglobus ruber]|uniref:TPR repeat protein n=1 Tax=Fimbriiglobus ruber TaxID=1908690 RepID=A0A225E9M7_9BACT|nr:DUF6171 family protein [Fimbriiglobus ruber]OWK46746.1 TPR repeat protein [Fimbriiglobus ruber]
MTGPAQQPSDPLRASLEQSLAAARQAGDVKKQALVLADLGYILTQSGDPRHAVAFLAEAAGLARGLGDKILEADVLGQQGLTSVQAGDVRPGIEMLKQALAAARAGGDLFAEKTALARLASALPAVGDAVQALACYDQAIALTRHLKDTAGEAEVHWFAAILQAELGARDRALAAGREAIALFKKLGDPNAPMFVSQLEKYQSGGSPPAGDLKALTAPVLAAAGAAPTVDANPGGPSQGPGVLRMAMTAAKSMARYFGSGMKTVSAETLRVRLQTCESCEQFTGARCRLCGCFTTVKARLPHEKCPIGKWPANLVRS